MKLKLAILAATLFAAQAATAGDVYVGAGIGQSRLHSSDLNRIGDATAPYGIDIDKKDRAGKVLIGKELNGNFALEASYFDLGDFDASYAGQKFASVGARGVGLDLVGTLPVSERFALLGRVGVTRTRIDGELFGDRDHKNTTQPKVGLGLQYKLTNNLALRGEYEAYRTNVTYDGFKAKSHVGVIGATLVYKFGGKPAAPAYVAPVSYAAPAPTPAPVVEQPAAQPQPAVEAPVVTTTKKVRE